MHFVKIAAAAGFLLSGYIFIFRGLSRQLQLRDDVNAALPPEERFEPLFRSYPQWQQFRRLYRRVMPDSRRLQSVMISYYTGMVLLLVGLLFGAVEFVGVLN